LLSTKNVIYIHRHYYENLLGKFFKYFNEIFQYQTKPKYFEFVNEIETFQSTLIKEVKTYINGLINVYKQYEEQKLKIKKCKGKGCMSIFDNKYFQSMVYNILQIRVNRLKDDATIKKKYNYHFNHKFLFFGK
jgi:tRNA 2-selenouridine synthase SelU